MLVKGCSGGEKRRVTIGESLLGFHKYLYYYYLEYIY